MRFAVAASRARDSVEAAHALTQEIHQRLGGGFIDLAFLFVSSHHAANITVLSEAVRDTLAPRVLVGCTGEGIIADAEEIEAAPAATLWVARLPNVELLPIRLSPTVDDAYFTDTEWPAALDTRPDTPVFLLLADPFSTPMNEVLPMISQRCPGAVAIGGLAGGGRDLGENRMLLDDKAYDGGLVGVAMSGPVCVRTVISQGCRPIGDRCVVTKSEHNVIYELGGRPALDQLQALFESLSAEEQDLAQRALHVGIVIDEHRNRFERGDFLVRNLIGADRKTGGIAVGEMVQEGQTVQFHVRDAGSASEDLRVLIADEHMNQQQPPLGALLFSCCGRGHGLFGQPNHDVTMIREEMGPIPLAGFFAQGEIGPVGGSNFLHGYTASVAFFSDPAASSGT